MLAMIGEIETRERFWGLDILHFIEQCESSMQNNVRHGEILSRFAHRLSATKESTRKETISSIYDWCDYFETKKAGLSPSLAA